MDAWLQALLAFLVFDIGIVIGFMIRFLLVKHLSDYDGVIQVSKVEGKLVYLLELTEDPEALQYRNEVIFKIMQVEEDSTAEGDLDGS
jgi:hypothetical protein